MSAGKSGKKKDDKPPPAVGPGSKIVSLPKDVKRHIIPRGEGKKAVDLRWSTTSIKAIPSELYKNEEVTDFARILEFPNNRIKKLPKAVSTMGELERIELQNNILSTIPASVSKLKSLNYLDISNNNVRSLPATIHKATGLAEIRASGNRLKSVPAKIRHCTQLSDTGHLQ